MNDLELVHLLMYMPLAMAMGLIWTELRTIKAQQTEALQRLSRLEGKVLNGVK